MLEIKNSHVKRLYESIKEHTNEETARKICGEGIQLPVSATDKKKAEWAKSTMELLDNSLEAGLVKQIRMDCTCGPGKKQMDEMKGLYQKAISLQEFADICNSLNKGFNLSLEDGDLHLIYPQCYCSFVKKSGKLLPKSWCMCSCGYTKRMFDYILDYSVDVELKKSIRLGDNRCVMRIIGISEKAK